MLIAYHNRGNTKFALADYQWALADYDKVLELDPQAAKAYWNRGVARKL